MAARNDREPTLMDLLTPLQFRVTILVAFGFKNHEIAARIDSTEGVVKNLIQDIFIRAGAWNRVELALRYVYESEKHLYDQQRLRQEIADLEARSRGLEHTA
ncbi:MAG TPA: hypothetical protein VGF08_13465 [Terriglobales bacterium]|jgi:DNA-binding NarL/FixJ family response regulator